MATRDQEIKVRFIGDAKQLSSTFKRSGQQADTFGGKLSILGRAMRQTMRGDIRGAVDSLKMLDSKFLLVGAAAAGLAVGVGVAAYKITRKLYDVGLAWDKVHDKIRIGTGATGSALKGLEGDASAISPKVASSLDDIGGAVASLNTRLDLTGKPLQNLAVQFLDFSRMTGGSAQQDIRLITRLFGDWGVKTAEYGDTLDKVWRTVQASDISVQDLAGTVVQYGAVLRQLGFSLNDSLAMLGKWEREGVNVQTAITGLRYALKVFGREGIAPMEGFRKAFEKIKGAKKEIDAIDVAFQVFGQRAGADVAAAIREGRFAWEDMKEYVTEGKDTIAKATEETESFPEKWAILKKTLMKKFEPVATQVFDRITGAADWLIEHSDEFTDFFVTAAENAGRLASQMLGALEKLYEFIDLVNQYSTSEVLDRLQLEAISSAAKFDPKLLELDVKSLETWDEASGKLHDVSNAIANVKDLAERGIIEPDVARATIVTFTTLQEELQMRLDVIERYMYDTGEKGGKAFRDNYWKAAYQAGRGGRDKLRTGWQFGKKDPVLKAFATVPNAKTAGRKAYDEMQAELKKKLRASIGVSVDVNFGTGAGEQLPDFSGGGVGKLNPSMALSVARQQLGKPYMIGTSGPNTFDCSGLVQYVYRHAGLPGFPTFTGNQWLRGKLVRGPLFPGDQLFFPGTPGGSYTDQFGFGHTGIYVGNGMFIHAPHTGAVVQYASLGGRAYQARRNFMRGGIVKRPTLAMIGEEGPEAVIPLMPSRRNRAAQVAGEAGISAGGTTFIVQGDVIGIEDLADYIGMADEMAAERYAKGA